MMKHSFPLALIAGMTSCLASAALAESTAPLPPASQRSLGDATDQPYSGTGSGSMISVLKAILQRGLAQSGIALTASGVTPSAGTFAAVGPSTPFTPTAGRPFNVVLWGASTAPGASLSGTVYLARSTDGGATYLPLTASGSQIESFTQVASESWTEYQVGVTYELVCSSETQPINWRFSQ